MLGPSREQVEEREEVVVVHDRIEQNGWSRRPSTPEARCICSELRTQVVALGTAIEHALDVVEACLEALPEHDTRVDRHLDDARTELARIW